MSETPCDAEFRQSIKKSGNIVSILAKWILDPVFWNVWNVPTRQLPSNMSENCAVVLQKHIVSCFSHFSKAKNLFLLTHFDAMARSEQFGKCQELVQACTGHWKTEMFEAPLQAGMMRWWSGAMFGCWLHHIPKVGRYFMYNNLENKSHHMAFNGKQM